LVNAILLSKRRNFSERSVVIMMNESRVPKIGDVYLLKFEGSGSEQAGWRPALIFQNNVGNVYSPNVIVLPLTSKIKKSNLPTHVVLPAEETGLARDSMVLCENPVSVSKDRLGRYLTTIPDMYMSQIAAAHILATSAISFINPTVILTLREKAIKLNTASCPT
jgi:mRNA interferase MazF